MLRVRVLLATASVLAAAVHPGPTTPAAAVPQIEVPPEAIVRLLQDRAAAYMRHDDVLLGGTMAAGAFRDRELRSLQNASAVEFSTFDIEVSTQFSGDFASPRVRARYAGLEVAAFHVIEEQSLNGYEKVPYSEDAFYTFVRSGPSQGDRYDGWRMASSSDFDVLGAFSAKRPWDLGPVAVAASDHFLLVAHPSRIEQVRPILPIAEAAYGDVQRFWPRPLDDRFVIITPSTTDELREIIQATVDLSKFVAFAGGTVTREDGFTPRGVRIYLQLSRFERYDEAGKREVLAHELVHAITRPLSGPFIPTWVEEGLAMFGAEGERGLASARAGQTPARFPSDDQFFVGPTRQIVARYSQAQMAIAALAARSGTEGVVAFYESLGRARLAAGNDEFHVDRAVREAVGWSAHEWTQAWVQRLR